jgi:hypothetical protein
MHFNKYKNYYITHFYSNLLNIDYDNQNTFKIVKNTKQNSPLYICLLFFLNYKGSSISYFINEIENTFSKKFSIFNSHNIKCNIYDNTYKFYMGISKLIHIFKLKYKKKYNNTNLCLNPLNMNKSLILNENNTNYVFEYIELYKICLNALTYLDQFNNLYIQPIKNPYTNIQFSIHNIYNIYFTLYKYNLIPFVFYIYYKLNFKIYKIYNNYNLLFLKTGLTIKYNNFNNNTKCNIIRNMFTYYDFNNFNYLPNLALLQIFQSIGSQFFILIEFKIKYNIDLYEINNNINNYLFNIKKKYYMLGRKVYYRNIFNSYSSYNYTDLFSHFS